MKSTLALVERYKKSLEQVSSEVRSRVNRPGGLAERELLDLIVNPQDHGVNLPEQPSESSIFSTYDIETCKQVGSEAIEHGAVAYCIMAGGAGTRIGEPKALLRIPEINISLLTVKLFQAVGKGPIWIVVSPQIREKIIEHVREQVGFDQSRIEFIEQYESYRLLPDNQLHLIDGKPDLYPCGHGDLFPAMATSRILDRFKASGGKHVVIVNVDNISAALDPVMIGRHILSKKQVSCEVVERNDEDAGGVLCNVQGSPQIVESFRIHGVDPKSFKWLNTNSFIFNVEVEVGRLGKQWNRVQKNVQGQLVIQHERLLQEITAAYDTAYLVVERSDRFMPVKSVDDLNRASKKLNGNRRLY